MERAASNFRILEYEVRPQLIRDDMAVVLVDMAYHRSNDVVIQQMRRRQVWRKRGDWTLETEHEVERKPVAPLPYPQLGAATQGGQAP